MYTARSANREKLLFEITEKDRSRVVESQRATKEGASKDKTNGRGYSEVT